MDDDGFYMGELNGKRGLVPSNFLQEYHSTASAKIDNNKLKYTMKTSDPIKVILSFFYKFKIRSLTFNSSIIELRFRE
jgi:hypothetical protein